MNQPHIHKDLIIAWANGAVIQRKDDIDGAWKDCAVPVWNPDNEYRIKPEPEYPKTSLDGNYLFMTYQDTDDTADNALVRVANAVIKQAILDGDVIINPDKEQ